MKVSWNRIIGAILVGIVLLFVIIGVFYTPYDPNAMNGAAKSQAPSLLHWLGTDNFGRDLLSRVMEGSRTTFFVAIATVAIGGTIGTLVGALTGFYGGRIDQIIMRINDGITSFPSILLTLVIISVFGIGKYKIIWALGIVFIPSFVRVVRSEYMVQKEMDYVKTAKLMGASDVRILFLHILPNIRPILVSTITIGFNNAVLAEAGMSYLGLGVQPPDASLGRMLSEAQAYLFSAPWYAIAPGVMIVITVLGLSLVNEG
ncbi:ABC transporter permease [Anaerosporobacter faecicola]|uniref:ABC transporter permease n=1 Tax=Anaerosporobacter faecicola TaxID=2718714 RepID=UPI00143A9CF2|nr:ABC transporter permease [Anaerosporobacter faecicola]